VKSGLEAADQMGLDVFVVACKEGLGLYQRQGFVLLDQVIQDDSQWGGTGEHGMYFLDRITEKKTAK